MSLRRRLLPPLDGFGGVADKMLAQEMPSVIHVAEAVLGTSMSQYRRLLPPLGGLGHVPGHTLAPVIPFPEFELRLLHRGTLAIPAFGAPDQVRNLLR